MNAREALLTGRLDGQSDLVLCSAAVVLNGETFTPDEVIAFLDFRLCYSFPAGRSVYGVGLMPQVVANSYRSLKYKSVNLNHVMRILDTENKAHDTIKGQVVAVEFPAPPENGGWANMPLNADPASAPGIHGIAALDKRAERIDKIIGGHLSNKQEYTVSIEYPLRLGNAGILVKGTGPEAHRTTPAPLLTQGYSYYPVLGEHQAPDDLFECWNRDANGPGRGAIVKDWVGQQVTLLPGGLDGAVTFHGLAIVKLGAEPPARIDAIAAGVENNLSALRKANAVVAFALNQLKL